TASYSKVRGVLVAAVGATPVDVAPGSWLRAPGVPADHLQRCGWPCGAVRGGMRITPFRQCVAERLRSVRLEAINVTASSCSDPTVQLPTSTRSASASHSQRGGSEVNTIGPGDDQHAGPSRYCGGAEGGHPALAVDRERRYAFEGLGGLRFE